MGTPIVSSTTHKPKSHAKPPVKKDKALDPYYQKTFVANSSTNVFEDGSAYSESMQGKLKQRLYPLTENKQCKPIWPLHTTQISDDGKTEIYTNRNVIPNVEFQQTVKKPSGRVTSVSQVPYVRWMGLLKGVEEERTTVFPDKESAYTRSRTEWYIDHPEKKETFLVEKGARDASGKITSHYLKKPGDAIIGGGSMERVLDDIERSQKEREQQKQKK